MNRCPAFVKEYFEHVQFLKHVELTILKPQESNDPRQEVPHWWLFYIGEQDARRYDGLIRSYVLRAENHLVSGAFRPLLVFSLNSHHLSHSKGRLGNSKASKTGGASLFRGDRSVSGLPGSLSSRLEIVQGVFAPNTSVVAPGPCHGSHRSAHGRCNRKDARNFRYRGAHGRGHHAVLGWDCRMYRALLLCDVFRCTFDA